ncbi:hypothetical protein G9A89_018445 [Geosiphon pyriformis]|nr:hypothetical protein G9A89_018445 [Geosiphon pyriformis]
MANGVTMTSIGKIDDLPIEINGIIVPIKVFIMEATQYQALVGNNWLSKTNTTLNWNTQELQLSQNGRHMRIPATCGHFKTTNTTAPLIDFKKKKPKPTWEAYQVSWADEEHNELPPILSWDNNRKGKQTNKLTWKTDDLTWTDNKQEEASSWEWNEDKGKGKEKKEGIPPTTTIYNFYTHYTPQQSNYQWPRLVCIDCGKKLSSIGTCCGDDEEYHTAINCPHDDNELWQMATTKIEGALPEEIRTIKNNLPESIKLDWNTEPVINFLEPEEFHEHYQNLVLTKKEQKQWLAQLNTRLCCHCLILSNFEYCDDCDLIYNPPPHMIYTIPKEEEPISSCASESESLINHDLDSDDDNKNTGSSSIQNDNNNKDNSNSDLNYEQYIALPDLFKEQELK